MRGGHIEVGGLLQAGLLMELGFPSWRRDSKPCMWVGGACHSQTIYSPYSTVGMSTCHSLWFGVERSGTFNSSRSQHQEIGSLPPSLRGPREGQHCCLGPALWTSVLLSGPPHLSGLQVSEGTCVSLALRSPSVNSGRCFDTGRGVASFQTLKTSSR